MGSVDFEKYNGIWDGVPQSFPWFWPDFGIFYQRKSRKRPVKVYMDGFMQIYYFDIFRFIWL
ncbi:ethanolamine-phosphate cytidylyltransferase [Apostasia shenzhenica]|uniref:Ethanolamine-phosphate cytidylyltransferase n=1 Tax=Apostasia shenzhenica TaxID=1088818 RepID=A0A2I0A5D0_9ASPA|nr:ethanolamine-phosphate cytidylyltransferase [Apostasia shenzhenica]